MSLHALSWAMDQDAPSPSSKLVLLILANCHNDETGACYPSIEHIADKSGLNRKTVMRTIVLLEEAGLVECDRAPGRRSTRYDLNTRYVPTRDNKTQKNGPKSGTVNSPRSPKSGTVENDHEEPPTVPLCPPNGPIVSIQRSQNRDKNQEHNQEHNQTHIHHRADDGDGDDGFDRFWSAYPRKTGKAAARKSWQKIEPATCLIDQILNHIQQRIESGEWAESRKQYIPHPATFLNGERWEDEIIGGDHEINRASGDQPAPRQTAAQRIAARRQQLATRPPDVGAVAEDDGNVWPSLDEPAGRGAQRHLAQRTS